MTFADTHTSVEPGESVAQVRAIVGNPRSRWPKPAEFVDSALRHGNGGELQTARSRVFMIDILNQEPREIASRKPKKRYVEISEEARTQVDETDGVRACVWTPSDIESVCGQFYDGRKQLRWAGQIRYALCVSNVSASTSPISAYSHLASALRGLCKNQEEMYLVSSPW